MNTIQATIEDGRIVPREPLQWPNGAEVEVTLREPDAAGIFGDSLESIAKWFELYESTPFPTMTDMEWAVWGKRSRKDRECQLAHADERAKALEATWK